jgi:VWFA-related protein
MNRSAGLVALVVAALAATAAPRSAQDPTFRARVDGVRVDVLVTERGRPVAGLETADFEVRDNGIPQTIDLVQLGDVPVGVVLAVDLSQSVAAAKLAELKRAGLALLDALTPEDRAALVTFNTATTLQVPLGRDLERIRSALDAAAGVADTSLADAALAAMLLGDSDAGRTLVVVFSDGVDTTSFVRNELVLRTAQRVNGVVYGVVSGGDDPRLLRDLASATGGRVIEIGKGGDVGQAFLEILQEFRRRYVLTFTPSGIATGGWHALDVRVNRRNARVQARAGYFAAQP